MEVVTLKWMAGFAQETVSCTIQWGLVCSGFRASCFTLMLGIGTPMILMHSSPCICLNSFTTKQRKDGSIRMNLSKYGDLWFNAKCVTRWAFMFAEHANVSTFTSFWCPILFQVSSTLQEVIGRRVCVCNMLWSWTRAQDLAEEPWLYPLLEPTAQKNRPRAQALAPDLTLWEHPASSRNETVERKDCQALVQTVVSKIKIPWLPSAETKCKLYPTTWVRQSRPAVERRPRGSTSIAQLRQRVKVKPCRACKWEKAQENKLRRLRRPTHVEQNHAARASSHGKT